MYTIKDAKQWAVDNSDELDGRRMSSRDPDVQMFNSIRPELSKTLWDTGMWLAHELETHGATREQVQDGQMALGQRAFGGDAWQAAVDYVNEFVATGDTEEKGGAELAEKLLGN